MHAETSNQVESEAGKASKLCHRSRDAGNNLIAHQIQLFAIQKKHGVCRTEKSANTLVKVRLGERRPEWKQTNSNTGEERVKAIPGAGNTRTHI